MSEQVYAIEPVNVRNAPDMRAKRVGSLAAGQVADALTRQGEWVQVRYQTPWRTVTGWAHGDYLAPVSANRVPHVPGVVPIPDEMRQRRNLRAQQYITVDGLTKYNLCGEFCAAALGGLPIDTFLAHWRATFPAEYKTAVTDDNPVGLGVVRTMLHAAGVPYRGSVPLTVSALTGALDSGSVIVGVRIDRNGRLVSRGGVGHWAVITAIEGVQATAWVTLYNPFPNAYEHYWLDDVRASAQAFGGVVTLLVEARIGDSEPTPPATDCTQARIEALRQVQGVIDGMIAGYG